MILVENKKVEGTSLFKRVNNEVFHSMVVLAADALNDSQGTYRRHKKNCGSWRLKPLRE